MDNLQEILKKMLELMGFGGVSLNYDAESGRLSIFIDDKIIGDKFLPDFVLNLDRLAKLIAQKKDEEKIIFIDVNNYRRERENIILELARGAARRAVASKEDMILPVMNAYERRLIHTELSSRPDIKTESAGEGRNRYVVVKPI